MYLRTECFLLYANHNYFEWEDCLDRENAGQFSQKIKKNIYNYKKMCHTSKVWHILCAMEELTEYYFKKKPNEFEKHWAYVIIIFN